MDRRIASMIFVAIGAVIAAAAYGQVWVETKLRASATKALTAARAPGTSSPRTARAVTIALEELRRAISLERLATQAARTQGASEAMADLGMGVLGWRTIGGGRWFAAYSHVDMTDVLAADFGVTIKEHDGGGGCTPPPDAQFQQERRDSYNAVMKPMIIARYGANVLRIAERRAAAQTADNRRIYEQTKRECEARGQPFCKELSALAPPGDL